MADKNNYLVALKDVAENDYLIFKLIFAVSQKTKSRNTTYQLSESDDLHSVDIVIDGTPPDSHLHDKSLHNEKMQVYIVTNPPTENYGCCLTTPLIATRVLNLLDQIVSQKSEHTNEELLPEQLPMDETVETQDLLSTEVAEIIPSSEKNTVQDDEKEPLSEDVSSEQQYESNDDNSDPAELEIESESGVVESQYSANNNENTTDDSISETEFEEIDFTISESEASELAIVHDESLSNPANLELLESLYEHDDANLDEQIDSIKDIASPRLISTLANSSNIVEGESHFDGDSYIESRNVDEKPKALVVDDSASVRKQIELELDLFDVNVDYAETAEQAFELLNSNEYKVAFLDVVLPDNNGFEICKSIKKDNSKTVVIMLTAKATHTDKLKGTLAGCDSYLVKPVGRAMFQTTVKSHLHPIDNSIAVGA